MNFFKYMRRGLAVFGYLTEALPKAFKDGQLTVAEMAEIISNVAAICNWDIALDVPEEISSAVVGITGKLTE